MKILIIEDEAPAFRRLQRILEEINPSIEILDVIDTVKDSVKWLKVHQAPDLIFMDIQLADGISFEIFESIEISTPVIFTTAYDEYTLKAFKVNSIDYLLKPIDKSLLELSLTKFSNLKHAYSNDIDLKTILHTIQPESKVYKKRFLVKKKDQLLSIKTTDIAYFYSENGMVFFRTASENKFSLDTSLDSIESQLDPQMFFRINRQCIVNIESIKSSYPYGKGKIMVEVIPKSHNPLVISRDKASSFKKWLDFT